MEIVDCKRWAKPVDVVDVGAFLDLVEDVGLLVSTLGASAAAQRRAKEARGVRLQVMSLGELARWAPSGTFDCEYRIPAHKQLAASRALRRAGFRVVSSTSYAQTEQEVVIKVFQHYGTRTPSLEQQTGHWDRAAAAMAKVGVTAPVLVEHGVTSGGGTPGHRWLEVTLNGHPVGLRILAATETEAEEQLAAARRLIARSGLPAEQVSYVKPDNWPVEGLFAAWPM